MTSASHSIPSLVSLAAAAVPNFEKYFLSENDIQLINDVINLLWKEIFSKGDCFLRTTMKKIENGAKERCHKGYCFIKLAKYFNVDKIPTNPSSYQLLAKHASEVLQVIYRRVQDKCPQKIPNLKTANEIRAYFKTPDNQGTLDSIVALNLFKLDLTTLPPEIKVFKKLIVLYLENNKIMIIQHEIFNKLPSLHTLQLFHNQIRDIPAQLKLPQLKILHLAYNQIREIPLQLDLPKLKKIYLFNNQIRNIPAQLNLPHLQQLDLSHNQINAIPTQLHLPQLKKLQLSHNQIRNIPAQLNLPHLQQLDLSDNQINEIPTQIHFLQLKKLRLYNNQIHDIPAQLNLSQLQKLQLYHNQIREMQASLNSHLIEKD